MKTQKIKGLEKEEGEDQKEQKIKRKSFSTTLKMNLIFIIFSKIFFRIEHLKKSLKKWIKPRKNNLENKKKLMREVDIKLGKKGDL